VAFWKALGFELDFETGPPQRAAQCRERHPDFLAEQSVEDPVGLDVYLGVTDPQYCRPEPPVEVVQPFAATHWGTQVMTVRDPDGRLFRLEAGADA